MDFRDRYLGLKNGKKKTLEIIFLSPGINSVSNPVSAPFQRVLDLPSFSLQISIYLLILPKVGYLLERGSRISTTGNHR